MKKTENVPVIMYHSIGVPNRKWLYHHLTCPYKLFESQLKWMKKKKFHTISLQDLYNHMKNDKDLPKNPVVLTFDDGYLDNWVFAYPLLKKYDYNGTIYVNPEFVCPEKKCRKTLQDVWNGEIETEELDTIGFLSWNEMKEMVEDEVMDIQSHAMTHTMYFKSNKIIDFRHPRDKYIWMTWNNNPDKKPYLQLDNDDLINYGEPVYEYGKAIITKRYFPDKNLSEYLKNYVREHFDDDFYKDDNWKEKLIKIVESYKKENKLEEKFETEEEYISRIRYELQKSKEIIENKLNINVKYLCWPIGGANQKTLSIASELGYISTTIAEDTKNEIKKELRNKYGEDPSRINRMGPTIYWNNIAGYNSKTDYRNGFLLGLSINSFQDNKLSCLLNNIITFATVTWEKLITNQ